MGTDASASAQAQAFNPLTGGLNTPPDTPDADGSQALGQDSGDPSDLPPHASAQAIAKAIVVDPKAYRRLEEVRKRVSSPAMRIREDMQSHLEVMMPQLVSDATEGKLNRLQFADFLAKYGLGTNSTLQIVSPDVIARLERQVSLIASRDQWDSEELLQELRDVWA